jgi:ribonucleoside-diphosphate reductase alpha chain
MKNIRYIFKDVPKAIRVISVKEDGLEDVYNGTVDAYHNFFIGGFKSYCKDSESYEYYVLNNLQCGELPLTPGGACLLGSINLSEYVKNPFNADASFDFKSFNADVMICIISLDVCLSESVDLHALQIQKDAAKYFRAIGLGVMGLAHMSIKLGLEYGSDEFNTLLDKIGFELANNAIKQSALLAKELGKAPCLENYKNTILTSNEFIKQNTTKETLKLVAKYGLRNAQLLTTAPTGSISTMIQTSGGIEPLYDCSYTRTTKTLHGKDTDYEVFEKVVEDYKKINKKIPDWIRNSTAKKLDYFKRIVVQSTWQKHIDNAISSTINLPESTTVEDIVNIYIKSWELGLKGVTVFRDNCRRIGILNSISNKKDIKEAAKKSDNELKWGDTIKSSDDLIGFKKKLNTGCGSLHVQAFFDHAGNFREIYLSKGSTGGCNSFMVGLSRMISLAARAGIPLDKIVDQLHSTIVCPSYVKRAYTSSGTSCPNALGHALIEIQTQSNNYFNKDSAKKEVNEPLVKEEPKKKSDKLACPECGAALHIQEGCITCKMCGYSKC